MTQMWIWYNWPSYYIECETRDSFNYYGPPPLIVFYLVNRQNYNVFLSKTHHTRNISNRWFVLTIQKSPQSFVSPNPALWLLFLTNKGLELKRSQKLTNINGVFLSCGLFHWILRAQIIWNNKERINQQNFITEALPLPRYGIPTSVWNPAIH